MTIAVTGASGHVGVNLVRALLERGEEVRALIHHDAGPLQGLDVELARGDVTDIESLDACFRGVSTVYHLAAHISITGGGSRALETINVGGTRNVVDACLSRGVNRLVHFSSIHAIADPGKDACADELTPLADGLKHPAYDRTKAQAERVVADAVARGLNAVIVAPTAIVGPNDYHPSHFGRVLLAIARGRLPVVICGGFDWVDVRDVVSGAIAAAESTLGRDKYILSGHWRSLMDVARIIAEVTSAKGPVVALPSALAAACSPVAEAVCALAGKTPLYTPYSVRTLCGHRHVSHARASSDLGYTARPLEMTLADTCQWFEAHGYLSAGTCRGTAT